MFFDENSHTCLQCGVSTKTRSVQWPICLSNDCVWREYGRTLSYHPPITAFEFRLGYLNLSPALCVCVRIIIKYCVAIWHWFSKCLLMLLTYSLWLNRVCTYLLFCVGIFKWPLHLSEYLDLVTCTVNIKRPLLPSSLLQLTNETYFRHCFRYWCIAIFDAIS